MNKFWNWITNEATNDRTLVLDGVIAEDAWWGDEVTPKAFRADLESGNGDITVWINSPGGDVFAAAQIYNMLKEYEGKVTVKIDSIAASAASVVAMAGDVVIATPVSMLMIHNPATIAMGDHKEMEKAIAVLAEVKESIINAYHDKTGLSRAKLSTLMENETWMNAKKALELGFVDKIAYNEPEPDEDDDEEEEEEEKLTNSLKPVLFSRKSFAESITNKIAAAYATKTTVENATEELYKRLYEIKSNF